MAVFHPARHILSAVGDPPPPLILLRNLERLHRRNGIHPPTLHIAGSTVKEVDLGRILLICTSLASIIPEPSHDLLDTAPRALRRRLGNVGNLEDPRTHMFVARSNSRVRISDASP